MNYHTFPDSPETSEFLSRIPHRGQHQRQSWLGCFLRTASIFLVLFLIALVSALIVDKTVPQRLASLPVPLQESRRMANRITQLEERVSQLEKEGKGELVWCELEEDKDKED